MNLTLILVSKVKIVIKVVSDGIYFCTLSLLPEYYHYINASSLVHRGRYIVSLVAN